MKKELALVATALSSLVFGSSALAAEKPTTALALAALRTHEARLLRCLKGEAVNAEVRLRVNAHGWTDVVGVERAEGRVSTCLRVIFEELHFSKANRGAFKGIVAVPVRVEPRLAMPAPPPPKPPVDEEGQASLDASASDR